MSASMDDAISRVDTMNNFPNVMKNLGISAEDSEKAINRMSKKLQNLPTTLNQGAMAVQRFTSANGNIEKSTDMFLALNNAILAGGASTEIQASALEQLSQAYAKGKPDMMEWRTLQMAMPAQLKQVASAFNMTSAELGEALRNGSISMDDFMNKIIELNKNGTGEFASFEEQASNSTNGLRTNITNLKTAIVRGMANAFNSLNESLQKANLPTIQEMIKQLTDKISKAFEKLSEFISSIDWQKVITALKIIIPLVTTLYLGFLAYKVVVGILNAVATAQALLNAVMMLNPIGLVVAGIVMLIAGLVLLYKKCEWFRNLVNKVFEFLKALITKTIARIKYDFNLWLSAVKTVVNFIKQIPSKLASIPGKIIGLFANIGSKFVNIGKNIVKGIVNGVKNAKQMAINAVSNLGSSILKGIKKVLGIHSPSTEFEVLGKFSILGYEKGLEKMQPELQKSIDGMFSLSPSMTGTMNNTLSPNINVTNNVNVESDPLGQVVSKIKTFSGGAKNDYNYGYGG